jgi:putative ABC transport system ATP-binding protein
MRATGPLRVTGVEVRYGPVVALHELGFTVPPGGMLAVTGPSGAGKTSLLWALAGAMPFTGSVVVDGAPVVDRADAARRGIALIPQGNGLPSFLTAEENVLVPLLGAGVPVADARLRSRDALTLMGLEQFAAHLVEELSGGQQQRVAVARTLAASPRLLLADEPTSDLDAPNRQRVIRALRNEADAGAVVVMATHDAEAAADLDAELRLDDGVMTWRRKPPSAEWDQAARRS